MHLAISIVYLLLFVVSSSHENLLSHPEGLSSDPEERFTEALNGFAVRLYKRLASRGGNIFFCPVCVTSSLTMVLEGTGGTTESELNKTLGFKDNFLSRSTVQEAFEKLNKRIAQTDCLGQVVNALLVQKDPWMASVNFTKGLQSIYDTVLGEVDFLGDPQQAVWDINELVRVRTGGQMRRVFERVDTGSQMMLVNAAYFKTQFANVFDNDVTIKKRFYNNGVGDHDVLAYVMEKRGGIHRVAASYDFRALELPCEEPNVKFWIFLPHKLGSLMDVEHGLSTVTFRQTAESFRNQKVDIAIPRIRFDYAKDIIKDLRQLGMNLSLSAKDSDYSGLSQKKGSTLTQVVLKTTVEINDVEDSVPTKKSREAPETSEIASVNGPEEDGVSENHPFDANHPFLFFVMDEATGLILYMGRVAEF